MASGQPVKPATHGKIPYRNFLLAEQLHGLGADLDIPEQRHMRHVPGPHFLQHSVAFLYHEHLVPDPHPQPRRI